MSRVKCMSGTLENMLWLIIGKDIRNDTDNGKIAEIDKMIVNPVELFCNFGVLFNCKSCVKLYL